MNRTKVLHVRVKDEELDLLRAEALARDVSVGWLVRETLNGRYGGGAKGTAPGVTAKSIAPSRLFGGNRNMETESCQAPVPEVRVVGGGGMQQQVEQGAGEEADR